LDPAPTAARHAPVEYAVESLAQERLNSDQSVASRDAAVGCALTWLAGVQKPDGRWSQTAQSDVESTALALLAFAAAGQSRKSGEFADNVDRGLKFLLEQCELDSAKPPTALRFDGPDDSHRVQALATLAMANHYWLTQDRQLVSPLQLAVNQLCDTVAQDVPAEIRGWRVLALKQVHLAYMDVPPESILALKNDCDQRAQAIAGDSNAALDPGVLLVRILCCSRTNPLRFPQVQQPLDQKADGRDFSASYFIALAALEQRHSQGTIDGLRYIQGNVLAMPQWYELDVQRASLVVMILRLRLPKWNIQGATDDDFPL
jgi:hypothetical protein